MRRSITARCIVEGNATGEVLVSSQPIAFLRGVDPERGIVCDPKHELYGVEFRGKILVFPNSVGSSVGAYVIYRLKRNHKSPAAIINQNTDIITASGCAIAGIPLYDAPKASLAELRSGMQVLINSKRSEVLIL